MRGRGAEKIAEAAKRIRSDRFFFIRTNPQMIQPFLRKDIKMVEPEIDHNLFELSGTFHGSQEASVGDLVQDHTCPLTRHLCCFPFLAGIGWRTILIEK